MNCKRKLKDQIAKRRHARVRAKVSGTASRPRISVYRSLKHIYAQAIDDTAGKTLASSSDSEIKSKDKPMVIAAAVGEALAQKISKLAIKKVVYDRGKFKYHGRVKALADGLRKGGLEF